MFKTFYPDQYLASTYVIDFEKLYEKGFRGLIFDIDNTLVPHNAPGGRPAVALFERLKRIGYRCCLISNNQEPRVKMFNEKIQVDYVYNAHKPSTKNYIRAMEIMGRTGATPCSSETSFLRMYGRQAAGIPNILVKPLHPKEEIQIVLKRYLKRSCCSFIGERPETKKWLKTACILV